MATDENPEDDADELRADAWCGEPARGRLDAASTAWGVRPPFTYRGPSLAPSVVDPANWRHSSVGWGVVLADSDATAQEKAVGDDAPAPIRDLIAARGGAPVLRYRPDIGEGRLRRYRTNAPAVDLRFSGERGTGLLAIPRYLLIVGSPDAIPWSMQCRMQLDAFVGRLDLDSAGLANYVRALMNDWADSACDVTCPLVWAVDHGYPDITRLMRKSIAEPIAAALRNDEGHEFDMEEGFLSDGQASIARLVDALGERKPAFVLTSSHGATFPLDNADAMRAQLGLPVDRARAVLGVDAIPDGSTCGAIWYAHACCSAGSDGLSRFAGLVEGTSSLGATLTAITQCGATTAPLPRALLGSSTPARAFIGHVEPTFNWTLRDPETGQVVTHEIARSLYNQLHLAARPPIGMAMATYYANVGGLLQDYTQELDLVNQQVSGAVAKARSAKLVALDRLCMVTLGDPTVSLPLRAPRGH
jgi:hypothetical protein